MRSHGLFVSLLFLTTSAWAINPINWQVSGPLPNPLPLAGHGQVVYTFTNTLPYQLQRPLVIEKSGQPSADFTYQDQCSGVRLGPNQQCTVTVLLQPLTLGTKQFQLTIAGYDYNKVPLPAMSTVVQSSAPVGVFATVERALPSTLSVGQSGQYAFVFRNIGTQVATGASVTSSAAGFSTTCTAQLSPGTSCAVTGSYTPTSLTPSTQSVTATYLFTEGAVVTATTSTNVNSSLMANIQAVVTLPLPASMQAGQSANYLFTYTNVGNAIATNVSATLPPTGASTSCLSSLDVGQSCTISGTYLAAPIPPSTQTVTGTLSYSGGTPATAFSSTVVSAGATGVVGTMVSPYYLPPVLTGTSSYTLSFLFTNYSSISVSFGSGYPTQNVVPLGATFTITIDNCIGESVAPGASCLVQGIYTPPQVSSPTASSVTLVESLTATYPHPQLPQTQAQVTTATTLVPSLGTSRTITVTNQCTFPVWFSLAGGALDNSPYCPSTPCPMGTTCNPKTNTCYWNNVAPSNGIYALTNGQSNTLSIPATTADPMIQWSGVISASTLCDGTLSCAQAACGNHGGSTGCTAGSGFSQPATEAEFTMLLNGADSYDVEVINGFHIPIQVMPFVYSGIQATPNNYYCGVPGSSASGNGFGSCYWSGSAVPSNAYYWVTSGGASCNIASPSCSTNGQICGLNASLQPVCGNFLGYWSGDQACAFNPTLANPYFNCLLPLGSPFSSSTDTIQKLFACAVPAGQSSPKYNSCYLNSYGSYSPSDIAQCCGCIDWWTIPGIRANSNANSCVVNGSLQTDPQWTSNIQPSIQWMKKACPSVYTYPFDDATSGFSCSNNLPGSPNSLGYTVTFCPSGDTGLPFGVTDGRG